MDDTPADAHVFGPDAPTVRAPGRVNLMGEHIDYLGLPVLPVALDRAVRIVFRPRHDGQVQVRSTGPYAPAAFGGGSAIEPAGDWSDYVRAGVQAVARTLAAQRGGGAGVASATPHDKADETWHDAHAETPDDAAGTRRAHGARDVRRLRGWDGVVSSDLPEAAGLASSSALVVAAALATMDVNAATIPLLELAELLAEGERYVGTAGGGMDQATCLAARRGHALRIDFDPLRATPVPVPPDWALVVAHSLEPAEKSRTARERYNLRSRQARDAVAEVADHLRGRQRRTDIGPAASGGPGSTPAPGVPTAPGLLADHAPETLLAVGDRLLDATRLARLRHLVTEVARVDAAERALRAADMAAFGRLMDASHASLRDDYEVSTDALDTLVALAREAGARGARLTGAGFGGCMVALCPRDRAENLMDALREGFYARRGVEAAGGDLLFLAAPSDGARVERRAGPADPGAG